jgi:hypothetical protein
MSKNVHTEVIVLMRSLVCATFKCFGLYAIFLKISKIESGVHASEWFYKDSVHQH